MKILINKYSFSYQQIEDENSIHLINGEETLYTNLEYALREIPYSDRDNWIVVDSLPSCEQKYWKLSADGLSVVEMSAAEKAVVDEANERAILLQQYETKKADFFGKRYHVSVAFSYLMSIPQYIGYILWCTGRTIDPVNPIKSFTDEEGIAHVYCNNFADGHEAIIRADANFTIEDVEDFNPDL